MSKYAAILHYYWNRAGGAELVCASVARAFEAAGLDPLLTSPVSIHVEKYPEWFGIDLSKYAKYSTKIELRAFSLYLRLLVGYVGKKVIRKYEPELIFTDVPFYKPLIKEVVKRRIKLIEYIHFPLEVSYLINEDPYIMDIMERYGRFPLNIYWRLFKWLSKHYVRKNPFDVASAVLTNSSWTANIIKDVYGGVPEVLNPPLSPSVEIIDRSSVTSFEHRENSVVMVGRFSEEKRYHWVITRLMPALRRELGGIKLFVFGSAGTRTSTNYLRKLVKLAESLGFKTSMFLGSNADIYLVPDVPKREITKTMDTSKVFLHATINEQWGVAVAEAMARGLPIIVHKSGGTWNDLARHEESGLGYENVDEAVKNLADVMTNEKVWRHYSSKSLERVRELTLNKFIAQLINILRLT
ncbi:MAG: glycosyltransferase family 4 protein [Desulfurococcaceae archaeon TW002]